jgi:hypothetical protein
MSTLTSSIGLIWRLVCEPARRRLELALRRPLQAQSRVFERLLSAGTPSAFGREHGLHRVRSLADFREAVPVRDYDTHLPWIRRLQSETDRDVLTLGTVEAFERSSGSSAACKWIPITPALRSEFAEAVRAWMGNLHRCHPRAMRGPAWWLISPLPPAEATLTGIPVGINSDDEYLGTWERRMAPLFLAVPPRLAGVQNIEESMDLTLRFLLHAPDLRMISVWNASYLLLLWRRLLAHGEPLLESLSRGGEALGRCLEAMPDRAARLRAHCRDGTLTPGMVWPNLALLSAWDGADLRETKTLFPDVAFQAKGLLATEGVVTIPWDNDEGACVPALNSHLLEFEESGGRVVSAHELEQGGEYGVILTTGGGLWRYRLGDTVRAEARCGETCRLRFTGRSDGVSDLRGEKLHPQMVAAVLGQLPVEFAMLAPDREGYTLFASTDQTRHADTVDLALQDNPHYALCRANGQLGPVRLFHVQEDGRAACLRRALSEGGRPGTAKSPALSRHDGWERHFHGRFVESNS